MGPQCNIICTQPRRISAIAVAERVALERMEDIGDSVGYSIRADAVSGPRTRFLVCTTGVLLRRLRDDPDLSDVTHVIMDEVHGTSSRCRQGPSGGASHC